MKSVEVVIIQTALRPMTIAYLNNGNWTIGVVNDFHEFFEKMDSLDIKNAQKILVNRGPGSYSGIRTGIAYVYGLLHGGVITQVNIISYTSFELISPSAQKNGVYLKGWPRIPSNSLADSKGYYQNSQGEISYISYDQLPSDFNGVLYAEEQMEKQKALDSSLLLSEKAFETLWNSIDKNVHSLEPLYVNPVHITSK